MSGWSLGISGTLIFERQHIRCSRETGWVKRAMGQRRVPHIKSPAAARNLIPPFPFPPRGKPGRAGSPHAAAGAAAPPARGVSKRSAETPLAPSPWLTLPMRSPRESYKHGDGGRERIKGGRHVGLDFYDLLIEPILKSKRWATTRDLGLSSCPCDSTRILGICRLGRY
jgi:hypothetical protein